MVDFFFILKIEPQYKTYKVFKNLVDLGICLQSSVTSH